MQKQVLHYFHFNFTLKIVHVKIYPLSMHVLSQNKCSIFSVSVIPIINRHKFLLMIGAERCKKIFCERACVLNA